MVKEIAGSTNIEFRSKEKGGIPKGAKILKKDVRISVEEIENGFIVAKNFEIKFKVGEQTDWVYFTKKMHSKTNPIEIKEDKMLAEYFD